MSVVLKALCDNENVTYFLDPVIIQYPDIAEEYCRVIRSPMDLGTITTSLQEGLYHQAIDNYDNNTLTVDIIGFVKDIRLIWSNCYQFNHETSEICQKATICSEIFESSLLRELTMLCLQQNEIAASTVQQTLNNIILHREQEIIETEKHQNKYIKKSSIFYGDQLLFETFHNHDKESYMTMHTISDLPIISSSQLIQHYNTLDHSNVHNFDKFHLTNDSISMESLEHFSSYLNYIADSDIIQSRSESYMHNPDSICDDINHSHYDIYAQRLQVCGLHLLSDSYEYYHQLYEKDHSDVRHELHPVHNNDGKNLMILLTPSSAATTTFSGENDDPYVQDNSSHDRNIVDIHYASKFSIIILYNMTSVVVVVFDLSLLL
jgi:hypothetical protein